MLPSTDATLGVVVVGRHKRKHQRESDAAEPPFPSRRHSNFVIRILETSQVCDQQPTILYSTLEPSPPQDPGSTLPRAHHLCGFLLTFIRLARDNSQTTRVRAHVLQLIEVAIATGTPVLV